MAISNLRLSKQYLIENCLPRTKRQNTMGSVSLKNCCSCTGRAVAVVCVCLGGTLCVCVCMCVCACVWATVRACVWALLDDQHSSRVRQMAAQSHAQKFPTTASLHKRQVFSLTMLELQMLSSWEPPRGSLTCFHQCSAVSNPTSATIATKIQCRN